MTQVFISYSRKDLAFVEQLAADLQAAGLDVWYDLSGLEGGQRWRIEIEKAIRVSQYVIVVLSPDSVVSEWVEEERLFANEIQKKIIPLLYKQCNLPLGYRTRHYIDIRERNYERNFNEILRALDESPITPKKLPSQRKPTPQNILILVTLVGLILVAVFGLPPLFRQPENTPGPTMIHTTEVKQEPIPTDTICDPYADSLLNYALNQSKELSSALGKQTREHSRCIQSSYQSFDGGEMIWRSDDVDLYVLYANHNWEAYKNGFVFKNPTEVPCSVGSPPKDHLQPSLGFGKLWCENQSVREKLGYATLGENADDRAILTFENGWLMLMDYTVRVVFYDKKRWESINVFDLAQISLESRSDLDTQISNLGLEKEESITLPKAPLTVIDPVTGKLLFVPFRVGSKISTQCHDHLGHPVTIQIPVHISHPIRVYLLVQAGWGVKSYEYRQIGNISLKFDHGKPLDTLLTLGFNIRDWADRSEAIKTLNSPYTQTAWVGFETVPGKIDILILDIPESYASSTLEEIQIDDISNIDTGIYKASIDPCIHLSAVTIAYLPLP